MEKLSAETATHLLSCRHAFGKNGKTYDMKCHILKSMPDGRLKVQVYGERYWANTQHVVRIRYVEPYRVRVRLKNTNAGNHHHEN